MVDIKRRKQRQKEYYQENKEKILQRQRNYYNNLSTEEKERHNQDSKRWVRENKDKMKLSRKKWLEANPNYTVYHNAYRRAKELNLPFDLHSSDILVPEHCPILGIKLVKELVNGQGDMEARPELDRVIPDKGYTKDNVRIISARANRIKNNGTAEEHRLIADYMDSHIDNPLIGE